jgi:quinol monooxygenase YgiN
MAIGSTATICNSQDEETPTMFAVVVSLTLKPGKAESFLPLMHTNARTSLGSEAGCCQFDVATDPARPEEVFLYELYDDRAAFDAHLATNHFKRFDQETVQMIAHKDVRTFSQVFQ